MAKMEESLISWNLPNFISFVFFIVVIWIVIGSLGHMFVRRPAMARARVAASGGPLPKAPDEVEPQPYAIQPGYPSFNDPSGADDEASVPY